MRIVNAELLIPTAEQIRNMVQRAYDAGLAQGRDEARRELQGLVDSPDDADFKACQAGVGAGHGERKTSQLLREVAEKRRTS